jgi:hypothetical protein
VQVRCKVAEVEVDDEEEEYEYELGAVGLQAVNGERGLGWVTMWDAERAVVGCLLSIGVSVFHRRAACT